MSYQAMSKPPEKVSFAIISATLGRLTYKIETQGR